MKIGPARPKAKGSSKRAPDSGTFPAQRIIEALPIVADVEVDPRYTPFASQRSTLLPPPVVANTSPLGPRVTVSRSTDRGASNRRTFSPFTLISKTASDV